jgi:NitT/TauT family transport system ATP-binding protein
MAFPDAAGLPVEAIRSVSFDIRDGEFVAILGPSGGGKTTLLNLTAGLIKPTSGEVLVAGKPVRGIPPGIGYMLSRDALLPWRTTRRNVEYGLELRGMPKAERSAAADEILSAVGLDRVADRYPSQLSSGMRQRVAVARTFATRPDILLMDEPFSALDAQTRVRIQELFLRMWEETRSTVMLVTHDVSEAIVLADRILVLSSSPAVVRREIAVPLPRPRVLRKIHTDPVYLHLFGELIDLLAEEEPDDDESMGSEAR